MSDKKFSKDWKLGMSHLSLSDNIYALRYSDHIIHISYQEDERVLYAISYLGNKPKKYYLLPKENRDSSYFEDFEFHSFMKLIETFYPKSVPFWLMNVNLLCDIDSLFEDEDGIISI